jgi:hypothetical protein
VRFQIQGDTLVLEDGTVIPFDGGFPMPLKKGSSPAVKKQNFKEFHKGKTFAHTEAKFGKERANKQAVAVVLSEARKGKKK